MSARAAWRLETLGYSNVHRYVAGKVDWLSNGLPSEGKQANEPRIGSIARRDVPTCRLGERIRDVKASGGLCVVVNDECVILGDLRGHALHADPDTRVEEVMDPGPSTYRPNVSVRQLAHHFVETGARRVLVSDADGHLQGWIGRDDVWRALDGTTQK